MVDWRSPAQPGGTLGISSSVLTAVNHVVQSSLGIFPAVLHSSSSTGGASRSHSFTQGGQIALMVLVKSGNTLLQPSPWADILPLSTSVSAGVVDGLASLLPRLISVVRMDGDGCWPVSSEEVLPSMVSATQANPDRGFSC